MIKNIYAANWHRDYVNDNGYQESEIIDDCYISSFSEEEVISDAKKLLKPYIDKDKYNKLCDDNKALDVDITVDLFVIDTCASKEKLIIDNVGFFDPEFFSNICIVCIENGEIVVKK